MTFSRLRRAAPDDIARQISQVPTRRATSLNEAQTAAYVDGWLRRAGFSVSVDTFRAARGQGLTYPLLALLGVVAASVGWWFPQAALLITLFALLFAITDALAAPIPALARTGDSQNVVATRARATTEAATDETPPWRVVLLAPLDAPPRQHWLHWCSGRSFATLVGRVLALASILLALLLALVLPAVVWRALLVLAASYLIATILGSWFVARQPTDAPGRAGALAVLLAAAERLTALHTVELWVVSLGATSTGSDGLRDVLKRYPFPPHRTLFVALHDITHPPLVLAAHEGILAQYAADPLLLRLATQATRHDTLSQVPTCRYRAADTIATLLHSRNYRTLSMLAPATPQAAPAGELDPAVLEHATALVVGMVACLDAAPEEAP
jgi:hypothetical protein